jgi:uncharacterized DUF497 family protein
MEFDFSMDKNEILFQKRGITFYQIIETIAENGILLDLPQPNETKYPNQKMFVVEYNDYTYCVPYVLEGERCFLKTIFPNRNFLYLIGEKEKRDEK